MFAHMHTCMYPVFVSVESFVTVSYPSVYIHAVLAVRTYVHTYIRTCTCVHMFNCTSTYVHSDFYCRNVFFLHMYIYIIHTYVRTYKCPLNMCTVDDSKSVTVCIHTCVCTTYVLHLWLLVY